MRPERKIIYEPHPVSSARKAELVAQGYQIIDLAFKPREVPVVEIQNTVSGTGTDNDEKDVPGDLTKSELQALLKECAIDYPSNATKADLVKLLEQSEQG